MKIIAKLLAPIVFLILLPQLSYAASTSLQQVKILKVQVNGTYMAIDGFLNNDAAIDCGKNSFFLLNTADNYKERTAFLLSAYLTGKPVNITYYGCSSGYIGISSVVFQ